MNNTAKLANQAKDASSGARYLLNSEFVNFNGAISAINSKREPVACTEFMST